MSGTSATLRWMFTSMALAVIAVVTLLVVGEVYGGTDVEVGATVDGEPAVEQLIGPQSGADVRNASVALGLLGLAVLLATYFYWRHTGRAARRRHRAALLAAARASRPAVDVSTP